MLTASHLSVFKPIIPRRLQIVIRRALVRRKLPHNNHAWPIYPGSARPPSNWSGWPNGKKFALVLTHDVDTQYGHDQCRLLTEIEARLGFRSSFNFVAEDYEISRQLLDYLTKEGFEIGQHGIHHTNPFTTEKHFKEQAVQINGYLRKWNAVGFRCPSMYHKLEWIHNLDVEYDASTFDTDPFEPQPDGVGTIYPFWVPHENHKTGFVELPYTLPQDFLLFILMKEKSLDVWKTKLEWIVGHGGMVLFITHPDYMSFNEMPRYSEYPARYYEEFLIHIKSKYEGLYWHVTPKDVARFWAGNYRTDDRSNQILNARKK